MNYNLEKLEQFVSLQAEFPEKKDILQYIADMKAELQAVKDYIPKSLGHGLNPSFEEGVKWLLRQILGE
ncbi:unnamed protein product [marine sediment metagenome]|uniref:Uncharacterized protein n=1 Tax=marine sediment metagenome TaxID=412755 RepID=X1RMZ1_9ZZZZ